MPFHLGCVTRGSECVCVCVSELFQCALKSYSPSPWRQTLCSKSLKALPYCTEGPMEEPKVLYRYSCCDDSCYILSNGELLPLWQNKIWKVRHRSGSDTASSHDRTDPHKWTALSFPSASMDEVPSSKAPKPQQLPTVPGVCSFFMLVRVYTLDGLKCRMYSPSRDLYQKSKWSIQPNKKWNKMMIVVSGHTVFNSWSQNSDVPCMHNVRTQFHMFTGFPQTFQNPPDY